MPHIRLFTRRMRRSTMSLELSHRLNNKYIQGNQKHFIRFIKNTHSIIINDKNDIKYNAPTILLIVP